MIAPPNQGPADDLGRSMVTTWSQGYDMGDAFARSGWRPIDRPLWSPSFRHGFVHGYRDVVYGPQMLPRRPLVERMRERALTALMGFLDRLTKD